MGIFLFLFYLPKLVVNPNFSTDGYLFIAMFFEQKKSGKLNFTLLINKLYIKSKCIEVYERFLTSV